ncbi:MAG TPA: carbonic anhydrase [Micromonosporaceae bacterium]|jgi:carbonic anhydrase
MESEANTPDEALALLLEGNARFTSGERLHPHQDADRRAALSNQRPFAVLFGCSDSRLAAEIIFDRGLGDLFVVRTAGHVIGPEIIGSVEYGVEILDAPLIAVLGHDSCGAIAAALSVLGDGPTPDGFMRDVVERVVVSLHGIADEAIADPHMAVAEHVRYTVDLLAERSSVIADRIAAGKLGIVGLTYRLAEGSVQPVAGIGVDLPA